MIGCSICLFVVCFQPERLSLSTFEVRTVSDSKRERQALVGVPADFSLIQCYLSFVLSHGRKNKIIIKDICLWGFNFHYGADQSERAGEGPRLLSGKCSGDNSVIKDDMADVGSAVSGDGTERLSSRR